MKKILTICVSLLFCIGVLVCASTDVFASTNSGFCGADARWSFDETTGTLTISGTGDMHNSENGSMSWSKFYEKIFYVVIEDGITSICNKAFYGNKIIKEVSIPDSVTSIGEEAFAGAALTHIELPDSITYIGQQAFAGSQLEEITIPSGVTELPFRVFSDCKNLKKVVLNDNLTCIGDYAFDKCSSLQTIIIPDSVTEIKPSAFEGCTKLTEIGIGKNVTSIPFACFRGCDNLKEIFIPDNVISLEQSAFADCRSLEKVTLGAGVKEFDTTVFSDCTSLQMFVVSPQSDTLANDEHGVLYSKDMKKLLLFPMAITGDYVVPDGTQIIGFRAGFQCKSLRELVIPDSLMEIGDDAFYECVSLRSLDLGNGVQSIGGMAFYNCSALKTLIIPASVTFIDVHAFGSTFDEPFEAISFLGNPPQIDASSSIINTDEIWYPAGNIEWENNFPEKINATSRHQGCEGSHNFVREEIVQPTCSQEGSTETVKCQTCGFTSVLGVAIPTIDHTYGKWEYITSADSASEQRQLKHTCTACGHEETKFADQLEESELPEELELPEETSKDTPSDMGTIIFIVIGVVLVLAGVGVVNLLRAKKAKGDSL